MLQDVLQWMGAGDQALKVMGPTLTIVLAWAFGGAFTQLLKFPIQQLVAPAWFGWTVRMIAVFSTAAFAHFLSKSIPDVLELGVGAAQPIVYWASLRVIRRYWPWMEVSLMVGSTTPPASAYQAADQRKADKAGQESGT